MEKREAQLRCVALAMHKAIIGIMRLDELEEAAARTDISEFLDARAICTYYSVYHLFVACMIMTNDESIKKCKLDFSVSDEEIDSEDETADAWNTAKENEQDWATKITHGQIKNFCKRVRMNRENLYGDKYYLIPLYDNFIDDTLTEGKCKPALYERLCYIRDRSIYRPSFVITKSGHRVQTSRYVGEEIRSLPKAAELFRIVSQIYDGFIKENERENETGECDALLDYMWNDNIVQCKIEDLTKLGHDIEQLKRIGHIDGENQEEICFSSYRVQLLETESVENIIKYEKKYWFPLVKRKFKNYRLKGICE